MSKAQLISQLYSTGHSRCICPVWLSKMLKAIEEAK